MKNPKTTFTGVVGVLVGLATYKGWIDETIGSYITTAFGFLFAYFCVDSTDTPAT